VLLGPIGGVFADRAPRRRIIVACDLAAGVAVLSLAAVMTWYASSTALVVAWLCAASVVVGATRAFFGPALRAAIPSVAPPSRLSTANSLHESSTEASALFGQAAGGVAFRVLGAPLLFLIDGASYLYAALSTRLATIPQETSGAGDSMRGRIGNARADLAYGLRHVRSQPGLGALVLLAAAVNFFAAPIFVVLPFFVEDVLHAGPDVYGYLIASFGAGGLVGYAVAARAGAKAGPGAHRLLGALAAMAACVVAIGVTHRVAVVVACFACAGACNGFFSVGVLTILQQRTPDAVRGRVFGLLYSLAMGLTPVSMLLAGVVADAIDRNPRVILITCGVVLVAVTGVAWGNRALRRYLGRGEDFVNRGTM